MAVFTLTVLFKLNKLSLHQIDESVILHQKDPENDAEEPEGNEPLKRFTEEELEEIEIEGLKYKITVAEAKLAKMKPNMAAIAEYKKKVQTVGLLSTNPKLD